MKRTFVRICLLLGVVGLLGGCGGGGGGDDPYDFGGRWTMRNVVTASNVSGVDVGDEILDIMSITQDGANLSVKLLEDDGSSVTMTGSCDTKEKTFSVTGNSTGTMAGVRFDITGAAVDDDSMSGTITITYASGIISATWTADLASRTLAASAPATVGGFLGSLGKGLSR